MLILCSSVLSAQIHLNSFEEKTLVLFKQLKWDEHSVIVDSLIEDGFMSILSDPLSMNYPFDSLKGFISVVTSPDKNLRFISWNTTLGGTMENVAVLAQYIGNDGRVHVSDAKIAHDYMERDYAVYFTEIIPIAPRHYLAMGQGKYSTQDRSFSIYNFKIEANSLVDTNRIFWVDSTIDNNIDNGYIIFDKYPASVKPVYDAHRKSIRYTRQTECHSHKRPYDWQNICLIYDGRIFRRKK